MMERDDRMLTVPKDKDTPITSKNLSEHPDLFAVFDLPGSEFWKLYDLGVLEQLNKHFHLMLDDYEEGRITQDFGFVLSEAEKVKEDCPTFYEASKVAAEYGTLIDFEL